MKRNLVERANHFLGEDASTTIALKNIEDLKEIMPEIDVNSFQELMKKYEDNREIAKVGDKAIANWFDDPNFYYIEVENLGDLGLGADLRHSVGSLDGAFYAHVLK